MQRTAMTIVRVMLVDDHEVVRTGLRTFLDSQDGIAVVGEADNGESAIETAQAVRPDVIVMDISMSGMDGLEATRRLSAVCPEAKVLALTVHEDRQFFFEMLNAGAIGYVTKQVAAEELVLAIRTVALGHVYFQPTLAVWLLQDYRRLSTQAPFRFQKTGGESSKQKGPEVLSKRELQVLEMVSNGKSNVWISEKLGISPKTVARHRERIMNKLDIHSTTELVKYAIRNGLIQIEDL